VNVGREGPELDLLGVLDEACITLAPLIGNSKIPVEKKRLKSIQMLNIHQTLSTE